MKIALVNTYAHGGAGIACKRLHAALNAQPGVEASLLYRDEVAAKWPFYAERLSFLPYEKDKTVRFSYSLANYGTDITQHPAILAADAINLHWINQGFLSLRNIAQLAQLGKPIIWTLHDMWAFTGGCHYNRGCMGYQAQCGNCPCLARPAQHDLSHRIWQKKQRLFTKNIKIATCSAWLAKEARQSGLLRDFEITAVPNPIDHTVFAPSPAADITAMRARMGIAPESKLLLFVAMKISEERKGFGHLRAALEHLRATRPSDRYEVLVLGNADPAALAQLPYPIHAAGMVTDVAILAQWYALADVFVIPSLEDNLPNTVMESLACGTPVVGFSTGGVPDMVQHGQSGLIVPQGDSIALGEAISEITSNTERLAAMGAAARAHVLTHYSFDVVAKQYLGLV